MRKMLLLVSILGCHFAPLFLKVEKVEKSGFSQRLFCSTFSKSGKSGKSVFLKVIAVKIQ